VLAFVAVLFFQHQQATEELEPKKPDILEKLAIRWTPYAKFNSLDEIELLLDKNVDELAPDRCLNFSFGSIRQIDWGGAIRVNTCREYFSADRQGGVEPFHTEWVKSCYWYLCGHLYFFQKAQPAQKSYLKEFSFKNDWRNLPLHDIFSAGEMGMVPVSVADRAEKREFGDYYMEGGYDRKKEDSARYFWNFKLRLFGWGDFNNDGIEDILLWYTSEEHNKRFSVSGYVVVSRVDTEGKIFIVEKWTGGKTER